MKILFRLVMCSEIDDEEEEEVEMEEDELEDGIQSVDSLSRYCYIIILLSF